MVQLESLPYRFPAKGFQVDNTTPGTLPQGLTIDSLTGIHNSIPANPIIALPAYLAGYIKMLGTGTTDVVEACVAAGLPIPDKQEQNHFISIIWRKGGAHNEPRIPVDKEAVIKTEPHNEPQFEKMKPTCPDAANFWKLLLRGQQSPDRIWHLN